MDQSWQRTILIDVFEHERDGTIPFAGVTHATARDHVLLSVPATMPNRHYVLAADALRT
jgi:hypothetical protein